MRIFQDSSCKPTLKLIKGTEIFEQCLHIINLMFLYHKCHDKLQLAMSFPRFPLLPIISHDFP